MIVVENNCVGCPQGCISCGRDHQEACVCDKCGDYAEYKYKYNGNDYCEKCLLEEMKDADTVTKCEACGEEIDIDDYSYDGMCTDCFLGSCDKIN